MVLQRKTQIELFGERETIIRIIDRSFFRMKN